MLIAAFELKKILFSRRGLIGLFAFALVWFVLLWYPVRQASVYLFTPDIKQLLINVFGEASVSQLLSWQVAEMAVMRVAALYLFPLFSLFICADQFASDKTRGMFRFLSLRADRDTLFLGRIAGYLYIQALLLALTLIATLALACSRDSSLLLLGLGSGLFIFINIIIALLPFTAMMAILSLYANSSRQATIYAVLLLVGFSIINGILGHYLPSLNSILQWILPGAQLSQMINSHGFSQLSLYGVPLIQTALFLLLGRSYMGRIAL
ncbi:ABC transporter permease subunit [Shewanella sp. AS1]|uniref:ABC transporter permease subunit n=1 Tax=Shewanella sp. AS1 TaxID=2907626 RepID=UPI001F197503|nr:ABC transporter permease subunit [Shewanella sp. AS1]MCE9678376.1 ABC transporter permease subunit [Shewanella sp. AS1]